MWNSAVDHGNANDVGWHGHGTQRSSYADLVVEEGILLEVENVFCA